MALETVKKTCTYYVKSLSKLNDSNYYFMRYEDMSMDQMGAAENIYNFINQEFYSKFISAPKSFK